MRKGEEGPARVRFRFHVDGIVQGVGFRPFVYGLAAGLGLSGWVRNDSRGVDIEAEGKPAALDEFRRALREDAPPLAVVSSFKSEEIEPCGHERFVIVESEASGGKSAWISPDVSICDDCLRELLDPNDRRHRYPFINCTNCGPRYTILTELPYDRKRTTMRVFPMCERCRAEYENPLDRRFHAQPVACWDCGPRCRLAGAGGETLQTGEPITKAAALLRQGKTVAVKGLGGFHLAVDARSDEAVGRLRRRKAREEKPLAVMARSLEEIKGLASVSDEEARLLLSPQRPVVLVRKRVLAGARESRDEGLATSVAPRNRFYGLMLPYTPLHVLLLKEFGGPLVMTSGNLADEPIATGNEEALSRLAGLADLFLLHDRGIHMRTDDSVARIAASRPLLVRRSRGYAPAPVRLPTAGGEILAVGAELKNTVGLLRGREAFLSQHIGDLKNPAAFGFLRQAVRHISKVLDIRPGLVACDMHPDYLSTRYAREETGLPVVEVQHHHAHVASCLAENGRTGPAIGIAFDGAGLGPDGTVWGGEVLLAELKGSRRLGAVEEIALPGGDAAAEEPRRPAAVWAWKLFGEGFLDKDLGLFEFASREEVALWIEMARRGVNSPRATSVGRLFDAASCLLGLRGVNAYEGQAACELEGTADPEESAAYPCPVRKENGLLRLGTSSLLRALVEERARGESFEKIAARFHNGLAGGIVKVCKAVRDGTGVGLVALSGGVFQNALLLERAVAGLLEDGFEVLTHRLVPPNDGGISLGQLAVAAARGVGED